MDNLGIVARRIVENSKPNPRKYGLVKQIGPYDVTPFDMYNIYEKPRKIRRLQEIEPDAVPNGVNDDLVYLPTLLGGGFSMENGHVVQEAIYDARVTAPGQKVRGVPMDGPGTLRAITSTAVQPQKPVAPGAPPPVPSLQPPPAAPVAPVTPLNPSAPAAPAAPTTKSEFGKEWWDQLTPDDRYIYIRRNAGEFPGRFKNVIQYFTKEEKDLYKTTAENYNLKQLGFRTKSRRSPEDQAAEKRANDEFWANMKALFGIVLDIVT